MKEKEKKKTLKFMKGTSQELAFEFFNLSTCQRQCPLSPFNQGTKCLKNLETGDRNVRHEKFTSSSPLDKPFDLALSLKLIQSRLLTMQGVIRRIQ